MYLWISSDLRLLMIRLGDCPKTMLLPGMSSSLIVVPVEIRTLSPICESPKTVELEYKMTFFPRIGYFLLLPPTVHPW